MFFMFSITFYFKFQNLKPCRPNWLWYMCLFYIYFIIFIRTSILAIWFIAGLCLIYITSFALNVPRDYVHFIRHHSLFNTSSKFDFESDIPKHYDQEYDKKQHFLSILNESLYPSWRSLSGVLTVLGRRRIPESEIDFSFLAKFKDNWKIQDSVSLGIWCLSQISFQLV